MAVSPAHDISLATRVSSASRAYCERGRTHASAYPRHFLFSASAVARRASAHATLASNAAATARCVWVVISVAISRGLRFALGDIAKVS